MFFAFLLTTWALSMHRYWREDNIFMDATFVSKRSHRATTRSTRTLFSKKRGRLGELRSKAKNKAKNLAGKLGMSDTEPQNNSEYYVDQSEDTEKSNRSWFSKAFASFKLWLSGDEDGIKIGCWQMFAHQCC